MAMTVEMVELLQGRLARALETEDALARLGLLVTAQYDLAAAVENARLEAALALVPPPKAAAQLLLRTE